MSHTPVPVFFYISCIDHQHIFIGFIKIDKQVIDDTSGFIRETSVLHFSRSKYSRIIGCNLLNKLECMRSLHPKFSHMGNIEYSYRLTDCMVFIKNTRILDRHVITSKFMHFGTESNMLLGKRSSFHQIECLRLIFYIITTDSSLFCKNRRLIWKSQQSVVRL